MSSVGRVFRAVFSSSLGDVSGVRGVGACGTHAFVVVRGWLSPRVDDPSETVNRVTSFLTVLPPPGSRFS